ncbi:histidine-type phosphatase [Niveispirillum sp. KHB5.9]|uniref:histidine-type phosphatase n=1 Tax=Niveispirillum sp. KHB5.9 TaxID=3400269 RepID=UPI003A843BE7
MHTLLRPLLAATALALPLTAGAVELPAQPAGLTLEKVAMFTRHGIRPPTKEPAAGLAEGAWPAWSVPYGNLTDRGAAGVALLGRFDRQFLTARGLFPAEGCPAPGQYKVEASAKERAIRTAQSVAEGFAPGCAVEVSHPKGDEEDKVFHPLTFNGAKLDPAKAMAASSAHLPPGGLSAEMARYSKEFDTLQRALGRQSDDWCAKKKLPAGCKLTDLPTALENDPDEGRPDVGGAFGQGSTISQTFLLEYLEGKTMAEVAWGRVSRADIELMLNFHPVKFKYENRPGYIADRAAAPIMRQMLSYLQDDKVKLALMAGHDTNIADLAGMLDLHWHIDSYPADDTPPGGAIGIELLRDKGGKRFVRAFYRAQTMDQLRNLELLDLKANPAVVTYMPLPGCAKGKDKTICRADDFFGLVDAKLKSASQP